MDNKYIILILVIILFLILFTYKNQENITSDSGKTLSDEALQNIASVYNTQNLKATNIEATNIIKAGNINSENITSGNITSGNITAGNINISGSSIVNTIKSGNNINPTFLKGGMLCDPTGRYCMGTNKLGNDNEGYGLYMFDINSDGKGGWAGVPMHLNNSVFTGAGMGNNSIVLESAQWSTPYFIQLITNGNYFKTTMQDGTRINFMFVFPNKSASNTHIWNGVAVKMGKQFLLYEIQPTHTNVGNVFANQSNDPNWRGNIN